LHVWLENAYSRTKSKAFGNLTPKWAALSTTPQTHIFLGKYIIHDVQSIKIHRPIFAQHNRFTALFPGPPGWAGTRRELLDFMEQRKINRGRHTDHPAGCHSTGL